MSPLRYAPTAAKIPPAAVMYVFLPLSIVIYFLFFFPLADLAAFLASRFAAALAALPAFGGRAPRLPYVPLPYGIL